MAWTPSQKIGDTGFAMDLSEEVLPPSAWGTGHNARFNHAAVMPMPGWEQYFIPQVTPSRIFPTPHPVDPSYWWTYPGSTTVYTFDGTTHTDITPTGGLGLPTQWSGDYINSNLVLSNGTNAPMYWVLDPAEPLQELPGLGDLKSCRLIVSHRGFLIAMDTVETVDAEDLRFPYRFKWSAQAQTGLPDDWDPIGSLAGSVDLGDKSTQIVAALPMRDHLIVYGDRITFDVSYIGGDLVWRFDPLFQTIGALSPQGVVEFEGKHIVLTDGDVMVHNGHNIESVIDDTNRQWMFDNMSDTYFRNSFLARDFTTDEILVAFPHQGEEYPTTALAWNFRENSWGVRDLPPDCASLANSEDLITGEQQADPAPSEPARLRLISATPGTVRRSAGVTIDDAVRPVSVERTGLNFGDGYHSMNRLRLHAEGDPFDVYVGTQQNLGEEAVWKGPFTFTPGVDRHIETRSSGLRFGLRFEDNSGGTWQAYSYQADVDQAGDR